mmetsp:Transcript_4304/g.9321  ORF Transcript_4304/g.9321 Transcript_4304/m.9321 type:complete len:239 (-) Transcript_4304:506-1222(-)
MCSPTNTADTSTEEQSLKHEGSTVSNGNNDDPYQRLGRDIVTKFGRKPLNFIERWLAKHRLFQAVVGKAFDFVDTDGTGDLDKSELYTGMLIVRLKIAKHAGSAACYPPTRAQCDEYFDEADKNNTGTIDRSEFHTILEIVTINVLTQMVANYASIILLSPYPVTLFLKFLRVPEGSYYEYSSREAITVAIYFLFIPLLCNFIEHLSSDADQPKLKAHQAQSEKQSGGQKEKALSSFV